MDFTTSPIIYKGEYYWVCRMDVNNSLLITEYGKIGGKAVIRERKVTPKVKRDILAQCTQELTQRYKEKIQDGYSVNTIDDAKVVPKVEKDFTDQELVIVDSLPCTKHEETNEEEIHSIGDTLDSITIDYTTLRVSPKQMKHPMLAAKYDDRITKKNGIVYPLYLQPKANGVRGLLVYSDNGVLIYSRTLHSYLNLQSLRKDAEKLLKLRPDIVLDGEIYATGLAGQHITSIATQKSKPHPEEDKVQFWVFDCYVTSNPNLLFSERRKLLEELYSIAKCEKLVLMETVLVNNKDEMEVVHNRHQLEKWEGTMLRHDKPYIHKRSNDLIKYKFDQEMDTEIVGVETTEGDDLNLVLKMKNNKQFSHRPEGSVEDKKRWKEDSSIIVGKMYSFSYTHLSEDEIPLSIHNGCIRFDL